MNMNNTGMFSSNTCMWATPQDLFNRLNDQYHFQTDVCAIAENAKCKHYFTPEQDGLSQPWTGVCWCNPPYGREIHKWVAKAVADTTTLGSKVVMLLPARTDTKWFHDFCLPYGKITFIKGRLKFGDSKNAAPFPSMIVEF